MCGSGGGLVVGLVGESFHELGEVAAGELPLEGFGGEFVAAFEVHQPLFDFGEVGEVVGGEHLALDDREVDLDLVEPLACTGRDTRMALGQSLRRRSAAALRRWELPLSTTQNTRRAEA